MVTVEEAGGPVLAIQRWGVWPPEAGGGCAGATRAGEPQDQAMSGSLPDCRFVDAAQRRRLSPLARICLHLAHQCVSDLTAVRIVFASRHGEINRTHLLLEDIAAGQPVSPTAFGLSVHNAIAGTVSLWRQDVSPATAVAAGEQTLGYGMLQAALESACEEAAPVLLLYADLPLHPFYAGADDALLQPQGVALLLQSGASPWRLKQDAQAHPPQGRSQVAWLDQALHQGERVIDLHGWSLCREGD